MKLDALDRQLIKNLQDDGRLSLRELGRLLNVPHTTVFTRVKKLMDNGIINKFSAILHPHDLGLKLNLMVIDVPDSEAKDVASMAAECQEVLKVFRSGSGKVIVKALSQENDLGCLDSLKSKLGNYTYTVYPVDEVVKYDHRIHDDYINSDD
jgi:DNA-binding Lrp family transcriptional regulator